jgi:hypothetical protein
VDAEDVIFELSWNRSRNVDVGRDAIAVDDASRFTPWTTRVTILASM